MRLVAVQFVGRARVEAVAAIGSGRWACIRRWRWDLFVFASVHFSRRNGRTFQLRLADEARALWVGRRWMAVCVAQRQCMVGDA